MSTSMSAEEPMEASGSGGISTKEEDEGNVFQFKIRLLETSPPVWRRIQVPSNYKFWGLHCAIQSAMGWKDNHMHCFQIKNPTNGKWVKIGKPIEKGRCWSVDESTYRGFISQPASYQWLCLREMQPANEIPAGMFASWRVPLTKYYKLDNKFETKYTYDFGDDWNHEILFEGIFPALQGTKYPVCLEGGQACPPEDCRGVRGFAELLVNLKKQPSERTDYEKEILDWVHNFMKMPNYDPDFFDPTAVKFMDPKVWLAFKQAHPILP